MKQELPSTYASIGSLNSSGPQLDCSKDGEGFMEQHTKQETTLLLSAVSSIMKLLVLYATLQDETPRSPYLQGHRALLRGQESTMAT